MARHKSQPINDQPCRFRSLMTTMQSGYGHKKAMRLVQSDLLWAIGLALLVGLLSARVTSADDASDGKH